MAGEVRREIERGMGVNVGVEDSSGSTRGQLAGGTVEVQVVDFTNLEENVPSFPSRSPSARQSVTRA